MRKRGRLDRSALAQFGVPLHGEPTIREEDPAAENETLEDIDDAPINNNHTDVINTTANVLINN